jgi:hypothetical protein
MEKITIKVTKDHFDKALAVTEKNRPTDSATRVCLLAQAVKSHFSKRHVDVNYYTVFVGKNRYALDAKGRRLLKRFDDNGAWHGTALRTKREVTALARLRADLPKTFTITPEA